MAGFVLLALAGSRAMLIFGALVMNGGNVLLQPSVTSLVSRRAHAQGAAMGQNNSFQSLGRAVGPLWAGFAYDIHNTLSFWTGAIVQLIALVYGMRALRRDEESTPPTPSIAVNK